MGLQGPLKKGISLEPNYVYKLLPTFEDGYQEDAEEFMCHLFNGINDEMIEVYLRHFGINVYTFIDKYFNFS